MGVFQLNARPLLRSMMALGVLLLAGTASAQYAIDWFSIDGGGAAGATKLTGGTFELEGTIGQADTFLMTGGPYQLQGGFWAIAYGPEKAVVEGSWAVYE